MFEYLPSESPTISTYSPSYTTNMATLAALLDELIIAISSHLTKPPDHLYFATLNHHTYTLINAVLYKGVVLHHTTYHVIQHANTNRHHPLQQKLWQLSNHLNTTAPLSKPSASKSTTCSSNCNRFNTSVLSPSRTCPTAITYRAGRRSHQLG